MYLLPNPTVNNRKWNLGRLGCGCSARGIALPPQKRMGQLSDGAPAGVPAGTVLAYSATWPRDGWAGPVTIGWNNPNGVQSAIQGNLAAQWGIIIDQQQHSTSDVLNATGQSGFVLQVHTNSDYGLPSDVQSIIDGAIYAVGNVMPHSTIRVIQSVAPTGNPTALMPADVSAAIAAAQAGYADAVSRGDQVSAAQFATQISQLGGQDPRGPMGWLTDNWKLLAAAGVGLIAVKELF